MDRTEPLRVSFADTPGQKIPVTAFVDGQYLQTYGTTPPPADAYCVVSRGGRIVGCTGVEYADAQGRFLIERTYRLRRERYALPLTEKNDVQLVSWIAHERQVSLLGLYHLLRYALAGGRQFGLVEHTGAVHRVVRRMGVLFHDLPHDDVDFSYVAPHNRAYYEERLMRPYLVDLRQMEQALAPPAHSIANVEVSAYT
jgi:hypothetical protein